MGKPAVAINLTAGKQQELASWGAPRHGAGLGAPGADCIVGGRRSGEQRDLCRAGC
jgi:hypothetical protein